MRIDTVIPTRNRAADLKACLGSLVPQLHSNDSVIVIDNGSTDETPTVLRSFEGLEVIHDDAKSLSILFNRGWRASSAEIIAFLNDDAVPDPTWLADLKHWFSVLPDAAAIGGPTRDQSARLLSRLNARQSPLIRLYDCFLLQNRLVEFGVLTPWGAFSIGVEPPSTPARVTGLTITNMAVRRAALETVGGFDQDFLYAHIDGYFFVELQRRNLAMYAVPGASVRHFVNPVGSTRSPYFTNRDQAIFLGKLKPDTRKDRFRLRLNKVALLGFWLAASRERGAGTLREALRGYIDGTRVLKRNKTRERTAAGGSTG
jgi:glycogen synthase